MIALGFDLYRKKILTFRLGKAFGSLVYLITKINVINRLVTSFALINPLGRFIYTKLSRKSARVKEGSI